MRTSKGTLAGLAFVASLAFVAGCQDSDSTTTPGGGGTATASARPASEELADAVTKLNSISYSYSMKAGPANLTGAVDPANNAMKLQTLVSAQGNNLTVDMVALGTDYYLKIGGVTLPGVDTTKYLHLDATKVQSLRSFGIENLKDPTNAEQLTKQLDSVEKTGEGRYQGTIDLTQSSSAVVNPDAVKALGEEAKAVPFEATVDSEGRLTSLEFTAPATSSTPEVPVEITYSDFGAATGIDKPAAGQVVEAPASLYGMFGG